MEKNPENLCFSQLNRKGDDGSAFFYCFCVWGSFTKDSSERYCRLRSPVVFGIHITLSLLRFLVGDIGRYIFYSSSTPLILLYSPLTHGNTVEQSSIRRDNIKHINRWRWFMFLCLSATYFLRQTHEDADRRDTNGYPGQPKHNQTKHLKRPKMID